MSDWPLTWPVGWKKRRNLPTRKKFRLTLELPTRGVCLVCRSACGHSFCSEEHRRFFQLRANSFYLRLKTFERDGGQCATCKKTTEDWQADHILPVRDGGGCCGLENIQTLCRYCHEARNKAMIAYAQPGPVGSVLWRDGTAWTREDDQELLRLRREGLGFGRLSNELGRTRDSIKCRLRLLDPKKTCCPVARARSLAASPWSPAEDQILIADYPTRTCFAIAKQLGRSQAATEARVAILGLSRPKYTNAEKLKILQWHSEGVSYEEIARRMDRPESSLPKLIEIWKVKHGSHR